MGVLTDDMTRLRNEVLALRSARHGLIHDMERETKARQAEVSRMLANFSKGLGAVTKRAKADRLRSISDLKRTVNGLLTGVRMDLGGIRQAWLALGTPARRAVEELTSSPALEAEADAEERQSETGGKHPFEPVGGEKPVRKKRTH